MARILSFVVDNNLGFEGTSRRILTANHHSVCGIVKKKIKAYQNQRMNRKEYHKTYAATKARINKKCRLIEIYQDKAYRSCVTEEYPSYSKGAGIDISLKSNRVFYFYLYIYAYTFCSHTND